MIYMQSHFCRDTVPSDLEIYIMFRIIGPSNGSQLATLYG